MSKETSGPLASTDRLVSNGGNGPGSTEPSWFPCQTFLGGEPVLFRTGFRRRGLQAQRFRFLQFSGGSRSQPFSR